MAEETTKEFNDHQYNNNIGKVINEKDAKIVCMIGVDNTGMFCIASDKQLEMNEFCEVMQSFINLYKAGRNIDKTMLN